MAQAMVADLPDPVMPSRVWKPSPLLDPFHQGRDGGGLVPRRAELGVNAELGHGARLVACGLWLVACGWGATGQRPERAVDLSGEGSLGATVVD